MQEQLQSGNFYEYSQFIKTIFFKFKMRRRFPEMQKLISKAMTDLGTHNQPGMVGDVFEIYYKEHVQKMKGSEDDIKKVEDKYLYDLCELLIKYCEEVRSAHILTQVAQQCVSDGF